MADRGSSKPQQRRSAPADDDRRVVERMERQIRVLEAELAAARTRIHELESQRDEVVNRIDWVIDSLHAATERDG